MKILFSILVILAGMVATHAQQEASTTNMDSVLRARKQIGSEQTFPKVYSKQRGRFGLQRSSGKQSSFDQLLV
jgi:hypothetical protein